MPEDIHPASFQQRGDSHGRNDGNPEPSLASSIRSLGLWFCKAHDEGDVLPS